jgi:hypothetical protein
LAAAMGLLWFFDSQTLVGFGGSTPKPTGVLFFLFQGVNFQASQRFWGFDSQIPGNLGLGRGLSNFWKAINQAPLHMNGIPQILSRHIHEISMMNFIKRALNFKCELSHGL